MTSYDPSLYEPAYTLLQMIKNIEKYLKENPQAAGIQNVEIDENNHLIVTLTDGTIIDAGEIDAGAGVVVDAALSDTSTNPVQNRIITGALEEKMENPMTSAGATIYGGPNGSPMALPAGNPGQVLTMGASGVAPIWKTPESGGMTNPMTALGDMIIGGVDGDPVRIAKGTAGQALKMNSAGTLPEWVTPPSYVVNPMTAEGDLIVGGASSGNPIRLGKGTAGQVLKMNDAGTAPEWGAAGGGGTQLYEHNIRYMNTPTNLPIIWIRLKILSTKASAYNANEIFEILTDGNVRNINVLAVGAVLVIINSAYTVSGNEIRFEGYTVDLSTMSVSSGLVYTASSISGMQNFNDVVIPIQ